MLILLLNSIKYFKYTLPIKIFGLFLASLACDGVKLTFLQAWEAVLTWQSGPYLSAPSSWHFNTQSATRIFNDSSPT